MLKVNSTAPTIETEGHHVAHGSTVLERVLLAIINAHTTQETEGRQGERLETAMRALIGPATPRERDMEQALLYMARQRQKDACDIEMGALRLCGDVRPRTVRSVPELATLAARDIMACTYPDEIQGTARALCKMYRRRGNLCAAAYDDVREALEAEAVQRICNELAEWDVPTRCET
jgi:hypothetical protein